MNNNMIPEDAVERGARVLIEDGKWGVPWEDASEEDQAETKDRSRAILEAALLPLLATK